MNVEEEIVKAQDKPKLNREQRRAMDRINGDATKTFIFLAEKYKAFFMENDPLSDEVRAKQKEVSAKWRVYCTNHKLVPEVFTRIDEFCNDMISKYTKELES